MMKHRIGHTFVPVAALAALIFSIVPCPSSGAEWSQIITGPSPRYGHAMAYDSARGVTVLFGGMTDSGVSGETWEWNGSAWTLKSTTGPSPRFDHAMAYDSKRGVTVLFGGFFSGETWEWNGSTWTLRSTSGPSPRYLHAMAYDSKRGVTVLFGGNTGNEYPYCSGETWEWDGAAWTLKSTAGPSRREGHAMAYDSARGVTVLFGGDDAQTHYSGETWEWNGSAWTLMSTAGPWPRTGHAMAYDSKRGVTVLFGGYVGISRNQETLEWDGSVWTLKSWSRPPPRGRHAMAYDSKRGVTVLFGGSFQSFSNAETWEWDGATWVMNAGPTPRCGHAMAYDSARGTTVLFGGHSDDGSTSETWEWDGTSWTLRCTTGPSAYDDHSMAYDSARGVTVLFGASSSASYGGQTWEWNGFAWTLKSTTGPSLRGGHAIAYDSKRSVTVLFGGEIDSSPYYSDETWEWNGSVWTLKSTAGPSPRYLHAMAYDSKRGVTVLFGGGPYPYSGETWEWNGSTWTLRSTTGPAPRIWHAMAYDSARGVTVLFGGYGTDRDTWEWDGATWTRRSALGPASRVRHAMAYDSKLGVTVLFGGCAGTPEVCLGDIWEYALTAGDIKEIGDGVSTGLQMKTVTAAFDDSFYVEETNRSSGIKVVPTAMPPGLSEGKIVNVAGTARTSTDGERYIDGSAAIVPNPETHIQPLSLNNRVLGGGAFGLQEGVKDGFGLNNIGLLVTVWGRVTSSGSDARRRIAWLYVDDGSNVQDGTGVPGVYAQPPFGTTVPAPGAYVCVTGISSCEYYQGKLVNLLRPRKQEDIVVIAEEAEVGAAVAEAGLPVDLGTTTPAVRVTFSLSKLAGGENVLQYQLWRDRHDTTPVAVLDGALVPGGTMLDDAIARTGNYLSPDPANPQALRTLAFSAPALTIGETHSYWVSAVYQTSEPGTTVFTYFQTSLSPTGPATPLAQIMAGTLQASTKGQGDVDLRRVDFRWDSTRGADEYIVEASAPDDPNFLNPRYISAIKHWNPLSSGEMVAIEDQDIEALFSDVPGEERIWWRVGARNSGDNPGPVVSPTRRCIYSQLSYIIKPEEPPPPPGIAAKSAPLGFALEAGVRPRDR